MGRQKGIRRSETKAVLTNILNYNTFGFGGQRLVPYDLMHEDNDCLEEGVHDKSKSIMHELRKGKYVLGRQKGIKDLHTKPKNDKTTPVHAITLSRQSDIIFGNTDKNHSVCDTRSEWKNILSCFNTSNTTNKHVHRKRVVHYQSAIWQRQNRVIKRSVVVASDKVNIAGKVHGNIVRKQDEELRNKTTQEATFHIKIIPRDIHCICIPQDNWVVGESDKNTALHSKTTSLDAKRQKEPSGKPGTHERHVINKRRFNTDLSLSLHKLKALTRTQPFSRQFKQAHVVGVMRSYSIGAEDLIRLVEYEPGMQDDLSKGLTWNYQPLKECLVLQKRPDEPKRYSVCMERTSDTLQSISSVQLTKGEETSTNRHGKLRDTHFRRVLTGANSTAEQLLLYIRTKLVQVTECNQTNLLMTSYLHSYIYVFLTGGKRVSSILNNINVQIIISSLAQIPRRMHMKTKLLRLVIQEGFHDSCHDNKLCFTETINSDRDKALVKHMRKDYISRSSASVERKLKTSKVTSDYSSSRGPKPIQYNAVMVDLFRKSMEVCKKVHLLPQKLEPIQELKDIKDQSVISSFWMHSENFKSHSFVIAAFPVFHTMQEVVNRIAVGERVPPNESMRYESLRLCSLRTYPKENKPYLIRLAKAGFYYASNGDEVVCYCCGKRISNWKEEDDPMEIHTRVSPSCSFVINNVEVNVNVTARPGESYDLDHITNDTHGVENTSSAAATEYRERDNVQTSVSVGVERRNGQSMAKCNLDNVSNFNSMHKYADTSHFTSPPVGVSTQRLETKGNQRNNGHLAYSSEQNRHARNTSEYSAVADSGPSSLITQPSDSEAISRNNLNGRRSPAQRHERNEPTMPNEVVQKQTYPKPQMPKHPRFAVPSTRLASFNTCKSIAVSPERVSEAGLFYAGTDDCTRCFHCGIGLRHWSADDDPWTEHARFSIDCEFVRRKKGEEFVHLIKLALAYTERNSIPAPEAAPTSSTSPEVGTSTSSGPSTNTDDHEFSTFLKTESGQSLKEMGYSDAIIKDALSTVIKQSGREAINKNAIMNQIFTIEESGTERVSAGHQTPIESVERTTGGTRQMAPAPSTSGMEDSMPTAAFGNISIDDKSTNARQQQTVGKCSHKDVGATSVTQSGNSAERSRRRKLKKEIEAMKMMSICSKCRSKDVCIVFLPCGHLITCEDCAPSIRKCTQCGQVIKGTVRTYRS